MTSPAYPPADDPQRPLRVPSDVPFYVIFCLLGGVYIALIVAMLAAEGTYTTPGHLWDALGSREVRYATRLSLLSCAITTILALWVAVPIGFLMSRHQFRGKTFVDGVLDIPIVLPPLVIGLCLLILFSSPAAGMLESGLHRCEAFLGRNLVPACLLGVLVAAAIVAAVAARRWIPNRAIRGALATGVAAGLFVLFARGYLFPALPAFVPAPEQFGFVNVAYRDQQPLRTSRHVYSALFRTHGNVEDVLSSLQEELSTGPFTGTKTMPQIGRDGNPTGEHLLLAEFGSDVGGDWPHGGEIEYRVLPVKPRDRIRALEVQLSELQAALDPVQREYERLRPRFDVGAELEGIREKAATARERWATPPEADTEAPTPQEPLERLHETLTALERQAAVLQVALDRLPPNDQLAALASQIRDLDGQTAEARQQLSALQNQWQHEAVAWEISCDVLRPANHSQADWQPRLTFPVTYEIPGVILAQFMVACAFAVRTMRVTFDQIHPRYEQVALTLGCNRGQAFWWVVFPQSYRGLLAAGTLAWARSLGEFGPILIFAGATRMRTEVLPTTVFLEMTVGNIEGAVAASLIMIAAAMIVLVIARLFGLRRMAI